MAEPPKYAVPLVVRYESLIALISDNIDTAVKDSARPSSLKMRSMFGLRHFERRTGALGNVLFKLRQWVSKLSYESATRVTAGPDVLEALEASGAEVINKIHGIFSSIANEVYSSPRGLREDTFEYIATLQSPALSTSVPDQAPVGIPGINP